MRMIRSSVLVLMLSAAPAAIFAVPAHAQVSIDIRVDAAPPPLPYYEQPAIPSEGYIWVPGYWAWDTADADYYWVPGTWVEPPQRELLWTPAYWGFSEGRFGFHPGYWGREVGFYGGIDYGYGYGGEGYQGGRWNNGAFFYNRTVNNFENVRITNVYNETVVVRNTTERVSFNGGNGGTTVRPTPQQETFDRERHVEATPVQRQQVETASKDRSLFSKQNHGEPAIAATPRAGDFKGPGVVRGSRTPVAAKSANEAQPGSPEKPGEKPGEKTGEKTGMAPNKETPNETPREMPKAGERPVTPETPRTAEPRPSEMNRETPKEAPKAEEPRKPVAEPPKAEERRPAEPPRVEERRPAAEPPKAEEPRRPMAEPPRAQERAPERAAEPRPAAQEPRPAPATPQRPAAAPAPRPAAPAGRPPAEEKK